MTAVFEKELETLKRLILAESARVEEAISQAIHSFLGRNPTLAESVIKADEVLDGMEIEVEEECVKILALHHPVANDLRFVVAVLKINNDLERMGDIAVNIARRATFIALREKVQVDFDFPRMAAQAQSMVKRSIDALVNRDPELARQVCSEDDQLDTMRHFLQECIPQQVGKVPEYADLLLEHLAVARHLERLGDMATNVAEDVIYMVEGEIIRHRLGASTDSSR